MSLKNAIKGLSFEIDQLRQGEEVQTTVEVSRCEYGSQYPVLGRHIEYGFMAKIVNSTGELRAMMPVGYQLIIRPEGIGFSLSDSLHASSGSSSKYSQGKFGCALTLERAEREVKERAKRVLEIICGRIQATKAKTSSNLNFVAL